MVLRPQRGNEVLAMRHLPMQNWSVAAVSSD